MAASLPGALPLPVIKPRNFEDVIFIPFKLFKRHLRGLTSVALCFARIANVFLTAISYSHPTWQKMLCVRQQVESKPLCLHAFCEHEK
jgi:hypothetical protein